ncbi:CDP-alcohol phosphatidyltransferase family protein [Paracoccaceae bacterium]|nr:CDP-alcohol phosphatidyltransferase family protein [Paracoccaceae bacterium]
MITDRSKKIKIMYPRAKALDESVINPFMYYVLRPLSFDFSILMSKVGISAIGISWISLIVCLLGSFIFIIDPIIGSLFFITYQYLDVVDGNVARLNSQASPLGEFLDENINTLAGVIVPITVGMKVFVDEQVYGIYFLVAAFLIAIFRLLRRTVTDKTNSIRGVKDRENIADTEFSKIKLVATFINALMVPSTLLFSFGNILSIWIILYFTYNFILMIYANVWAIKRLGADRNN